MLNRIEIDKVEETEVLPGCFARIMHADSMTVVFWRLIAGTSVPRHSHLSEQITQLIEGEMELTIDSEHHQLKSGQIIRIPSDVPHSVTTHTECKIVDIFSPARDDLEGLLL